MLQRAVSLMVALFFIVFAFIHFEGGRVLLLGGYLVFCLACIWFAEAMGEFTGTLGGNPGTAKSPAFLVRFFGWILLFLPGVFYLAS